MQILKIASKKREELIDITAHVRRIAAQCPHSEGAVLLFCQHTTCGLTINESADPDVRTDLMRFFGAIAPRSNGWLHAEGNTDAHIRSSLLGASLIVPVLEGQLLLGHWQAIYLYEGDGPRERRIVSQFLQAV